VKVTLICPNLGGNVFGRTYILARALAPLCEVEITGISVTDPPVWPVCDTGEFPVTVHRAGPLPGFLARLPAIVGGITGDLVYACKPLPASVWPAVRWRRRTGGPLWLDVDDDEWGRYVGSPPYLKARAPLDLARSVSHTRSVRFAYPLIPPPERVTVSSDFLQARYGGEVVHHGRDTDAFDPARFDREAIRRELGLEGRFVVLFQGTPRAHKGLGMLVEVLEGLLPTVPVRFVLVGVGPGHPEARALARRAPRLLAEGERCFLGMQPFDRVPYYLTAADVVALPQDPSPFARGQTPAKVFDAMAMARPVVAGAAADLAEVLDGCGWVVPPGDPEALRAALEAAWADPERRERYGREGRRRCVAKYSLARMTEVLGAMLETAGQRG